MDKIFALDLGTTKFCIARYNPKSSSNTISIASIPSQGMRRGMLADFQKVATALERLVETSENKFDSDIRHVVIGVAGSHLRSRIIDFEMGLADHTVSYKTLKKMRAKAEKDFTEPGREILHIIPNAYSVDHRGWTDNPINLSGNKLRAKYFVLDADQLYLRDIIGAANQAGLEVSKLYAEPFASSCVTAPIAERNLGMAICDIGGGTTDGIIFIGGQAKSCFTFNIAGLMMTNDIAIGLNLSIEEAEKAKNYFGLSGSRSDFEFEVRDLKREKKTIRGHQVQKILVPRILEWSEELSNYLAPFRGQLGSGLLLTGGGASMLSLAGLLEHQFKIPVRTCFPSFGSIDQAAKFASKYATVIGLLQLEIDRLNREGHDPYQSFKLSFLRNVAQWIRELS